jgi:glycerol-3-phosphate cytidylyltransferase
MCNKGIEMNLDRVSILIKSFRRKDSVDNLIKSIRKFYLTVPIIVVDDSGFEYNFDYDNNIKTYNLPFDVGVSAGRNFGLEQIKTDYFVLCDDDFEFTEQTNLEEFFRIARLSNLDILGGLVYERNKPLMYYGNFEVDNEDRSVKCVSGYTQHNLYNTCDLIPQFFIGKTKKVKKYGWDPELKTAEHSAFFFEHRGTLSVGWTDRVSVEHTQTRNEDYSQYRQRGEYYFNYWLDKKRIAHFVSLKNEHHRRLHKEYAIANLKSIAEIFDKNNIPYWLTDGTLLGYYRERDFISHDHDTDIGVMFKDFSPHVLKKLTNAGFKIDHIFGYPEDSLEIALVRDGVKTDLFFFYERGHNKVYHCAFLKTTQRIDYEYEKFDLQKINFLGYSFFAPNDILKYVTTKYGQTWNTPVKDWDWAYSPCNHVKTGIVIDLHQQKERFNNWLKSESVVITYGTFDTFHYGHIELFLRAKQLGQRLIVAVSTDEFNLRKGKTSMFDYEKRKAWVESLRCVDMVIPEESWDQKIKDISEYGVNTLVMGDDWTGKFDDLPCEVVYLPRTPEISSTTIKQAIK